MDRALVVGAANANVGSYIGNGSSITIELGFRPVKVRLVNATEDYTEEVLKLEGMADDTCQLNKNSKGKILSGGITILDDGFVVGDSQYVNRNGDTYLWEAL
jgi:hypothetical protein